MSVSAPELDDWYLYYQIEPFGQWRLDHAAGVIAATVANVNRAKGDPARHPRDYMPLIDAPKPQKSVAALHAAMVAWMRPKAPAKA